MDHKIVVFAIEKTCQFLHSVNMRTIQFSMHWLGGLHSRRLVGSTDQAYSSGF